METNKCPEFPFFGATYPDATCIDGKLFDLDSYEEDGFQNGDRVRVTMGISGRKNEKDGKERVFNSLNGFGITKL